jgi:hypothetical protein
LPALVVLLVMLVAGPIGAYMPVSALAAALIITAYNMIDKAEIRRILRGAPGDAIIMIVTFLGTLFLNLDFAVLSRHPAVLRPLPHAHQRAARPGRRARQRLTATSPTGPTRPSAPNWALSRFRATSTSARSTTLRRQFCTNWRRYPASALSAHPHAPRQPD